VCDGDLGLGGKGWSREEGGGFLGAVDHDGGWLCGIDEITKELSSIGSTDDEYEDGDEDRMCRV